MAGRPPKESIDYAGWSVDIFDNDTKIDKLLDAQGASGFLIYFYLCQKAYGSNGYYFAWSYDDSATTARKIGGGVGSDTVKQTVALCLQIGLFDKNLFDRDGVITSRGIQKRFWQVAKDRKNLLIKKELWLLSEGDCLRFDNDTTKFNLEPVKSNCQQQKESKVKESKVKESKLNNIKENILKESTFTKSSEIRELAKKLCPSVSKRFEDKIELYSIYALSELEDTLTALNLPNDEYEKLFKHVNKTYISEIKWTNLDLLWVLQHIQKVNGIEEINYKKVAPVKKVDGSKYERSE